MFDKEWVFSLADALVHDENEAGNKIEYLNSLEVSGLPPHRLWLKPGMLTFLCNLVPMFDLCNETWLYVQHVIN